MVWYDLGIDKYSLKKIFLKSQSKIWRFFVDFIREKAIFFYNKK